MYKKYYSQFLKANEGKQHYTAHSHHYWPDVTFDAMMEYWNDSARLVDDKWAYILGTKVPATQKLIAKVLNFSNPENICFAPNTHDLFTRVLSSFQNKKIKILTTDSEFYSFSRQVNWMSELKLIDLIVVPSAPYDTFNERFKTEIQKNDFDVIFFSQVFFNSAIIVDDLESIVQSVENEKTIIFIDGYHGFMAVPTDLSQIENRVFYIAGSYKYAQGGEGCCFMTIPQNCPVVPTLTGWYAGFQDLENNNSHITFNKNGSRFAGSSMDYTALYRLHAVLKLYADHHISVDEIHAFVQKLQKNFLNYIDEIKHPHIHRKNLLMLDPYNHGHFLSFKMPSVEICKEVKAELLAKNVITDSRGTILRFGFAIYQNEKPVF
mgnify:CR=1 FL=1